MANPLIGQILGSVLGRAMGGGGFGAGPIGGGGGLPGGLGSILGGVLGGGRGLPGGTPVGVPRGGGLGGLGGNRTALLAMMLPLVMAWVRRNGGVGNVLQRVNQHGYGGQANSWVGTGRNEDLPPQAARQLLGEQDLAALSQQLGVGEDEAAQGFSEILPEVVDQLSPEGQLPPDADQRLDAGQSALERMLQQVH